jgi:hypothetical protein
MSLALIFINFIIGVASVNILLSPFRTLIFFHHYSILVMNLFFDLENVCF